VSWDVNNGRKNKPRSDVGKRGPKLTLTGL
jgi:hypothetical protein